MKLKILLICSLVALTFFVLSQPTCALQAPSDLFLGCMRDLKSCGRRCPIGGHTTSNQSPCNGVYSVPCFCPRGAQHFKGCMANAHACLATYPSGKFFPDFNKDFCPGNSLPTACFDRL